MDNVGTGKSESRHIHDTDKTYHKTRQDKIGQDKTRHDKTRQDKTRQEKKRKEKTRQDKTGQLQGKAGQDKRQDKTTTRQVKTR
jgi:hypothetical protein